MTKPLESFLIGLRPGTENGAIGVESVIASADMTDGDAAYLMLRCRLASDLRFVEMKLPKGTTLEGATAAIHSQSPDARLALYRSGSSIA
jgi:hypothetical protein